jgi:UDP-4-amino-4,6-dideoxy-N-acetyl-beta-L-altrosamine N-acetyltransferase
MIISGYGITLKSLTLDDIELVRQQRNSDHIRRYMTFREEISPEMQLKWFHSINNENNNYYIVHYQNKKIGLISGAEVDWENAITNNGGMFIWDSEYHGTHVPLCASILLTDFSFFIGLKKTCIKVLRNNKRALDYNQRLGYQLMEDDLSKEYQLYELNMDSYIGATIEFKKILSRNKETNTSLSIEINRPEDPWDKRVASQLSGLTMEKRNLFSFAYPYSDAHDTGK